jgi:hypothetical protein
MKICPEHINPPEVDEKPPDTVNSSPVEEAAGELLTL